ncbi:MAG: FAD-dependent oxidoreductase [Coraliomargaritaceae bacterium]
MDDGVELTVSDSSGNNNHASASEVRWVAGVRNASLQLNYNCLVQAPDSDSLAITDSITIQTWMKPWSPKFQNKPTLLRKEGAYALHMGPGKQVTLTLWIDGKEESLSSKHEDWPNSQWQHVAGTFDGQTMKVYVNGKLDNERQLSKPAQISTSQSPVHIGSVKRRSPFTGTIDELILRDSATPAEGIAEAFESGMIEFQKANSRFINYFSKGVLKREPKEVVKGFLWIDAEDFTDYGGWVMDSQFVPQMGSPYLLATGIGEPVDPAKTTVNIRKSGNYRLWVRNRNWIPEHSPGTFTVSIDDQRSETTFGTADHDEWAWQDGGLFRLTAGNHTLSIQDQTGFYGRCDAILLTRDKKYQPPQDLDGYKSERDRLLGLETDIETVGEYDVVVIGGGVAGINAAISAARNGAKTALIQNRPMLGGNNSAEMGVPVLGPADYGKKNARESGLNEEIGRYQSYNFLSKWSTGGQRIAEQEENLSIFLNRHVYETEMDGQTITAVRAFDMITNELTRYSGKIFIDCTGDGWVGYYAGAEYMFGREAKATFGESNAPEAADDLTMSGSLFHGAILGYKTMDSGEPFEMKKEDWYWDLSFNTEPLQDRTGYSKTHKSGNWWHENRNDVDDLWDPEYARDGLIRVSLSYVYWIKTHSSLKDEAENFKIEYLPVTNARRETRRLTGDHILTQDELIQAKPFDDAIGTGGWGLDIHHIDGIFSTEGPFDFNTYVPTYNIPFRSLYSKNIDNLMFAGRNISVSRVALGSVRVQGTTGVMGQAVGTAGALCIQHNTTPRGIYQNHIKELQQELIKDDQYILDLKGNDEKDLARKATITASSAVSSPEFVINGITRVIGEETNMWISSPEQTLPQWIEVEFKSSKEINTLYLTFDTNVNEPKHATWEYKDTHRMPPEAVKDYEILYQENGEWVSLLEEENNYQRRRIHTFDTIKTKKIRVLVKQTNGDPSARLYEIRAYRE